MILLILKVLLGMTIVGILITLGFGFNCMVKGTQKASLESNKLMRLRVSLQAIAVFLFTLILILSSQR